MKISVLGSGWLGLPLATELVEQGHHVNLSTRSESRLVELDKISVSSFIIDINEFSTEVKLFLDADILIINITSKDIVSYANLIKEIENSAVSKVLFISSTSVYQAGDCNVTEKGQFENPQSVLFQIEQLFRSNSEFKTTILRLSGLVGYSRHPGRFFKNGKLVQQPDTPVNLIHRDDCIGIINSIIEQAAWGEVFNGCATTHPNKRAFYSHARSLLNLPAPEFNEATANQVGKVVSNDKVIKQLAYEFLYPDVMSIKFDA